MIITIFGAGHGGQAMAADLTLGGHEVRLAAVPEHSTNIQLLNAFGCIVLEGITSSGAPVGPAKPAMMTTDIPAVIKGAEVIMIVVPAFGQKVYLDAIIEHGEKGQIVVLNPGSFGSLEFAQMLKQKGREKDFIFGETSSLIYAAKTKGLGHVNLKAVKDELPFAAFPSVKTAEALWKLMDIYPQFMPAPNVLATSIDAPGLIVHPITTLLNMSRIEQMGPYKTSHYDITPSIANIMEKIDNERMDIAKKLNYETYSFMEMAQIMYKVRPGTLYEMVYQISAHNVQMAPESMKHRYITEDVPFGLVPLSSIGKLLNISTPGIDSIINLSSMANKTDYWAIGRTVEKLGLKDFPMHRLIEYVTGKLK